MKRLAFFLVFFMGFAVISGFCSGKKTKALETTITELQNNIEALNYNVRTLNADKDNLNKKIADLEAHKERLTLVTWEIVNGAGESLLNDLDYYLSAPLTLITDNQNREFAAKDRALIITKKNDSSQVDIESTDKGKS
jgi:outer membrane murein-binding lipoprotein Lpp